MKTRLPKIGPGNLRKILYMPSLIAKHFNPIIKQFCTKLKERGKHNMAIIAAAIRKLLHIAYRVLKSKRPFDLNFSSSVIYP